MPSKATNLVFVVLVCAIAVPMYAGASISAAIFYTGLCVTLANPASEYYRQDKGKMACAAKDNVRSQFTLGKATIETPTLNEGRYCTGTNARGEVCTPMSQNVSTVRSKDSMLIAFSAGSNGMKQLVDHMKATNSQDLLKIKRMVSLEATSGPFNAAVQTVKEVNPGVQVHHYSAKQFDTYHDGMPGSPKMAAEMLRLMGADVPPTLFTKRIETEPDTKKYAYTYTGTKNQYDKNLNLSSLFGQGQPYTGAYGAQPGAGSPFSSLFSAFSPPPQSAFPSQPLPNSLSVLNSNPTPTQPGVQLTSSVSSGNAGTLAVNTKTSQPVTENTYASNTPIQNGNTTFTPDRVDVSYTTPDRQSADICATLIDLYTKVRDILQRWVDLLRAR